MKQNNEHPNDHQANHAPGAGSDKFHPDTPADANERFRKQNQDENKEPHHK